MQNHRDILRSGSVVRPQLAFISAHDPIDDALDEYTRGQRAGKRGDNRIADTRESLEEHLGDGARECAVHPIVRGLDLEGGVQVRYRTDRASTTGENARCSRSCPSKMN